MYKSQSGKILFPVIILILVTITGYFYLPVSHSKTSGFKRSATQVSAVEAQASSEVLTLDSIGTARANQAIDIISAQSDYIESLLFDDGDYVQAGSTLATLKNKQERLATQELKVNLKEQQRQLNRLRELARSQSTAQSQLEAQRSTVEALEVQLANTESKLQEMTIKAPFSGLLGKRLVAVGSFVNSNTAITTLDDISIIKVDFDVPEKYLARLAHSMTVTATSEAYPEQTFTGQVTHIDPRINQSTRSVSVTASFSNEQQQLRPGMLLQVALHLETIKAIMLPEKSIIPRQDKHFVFVIDEQNKAQQVQVKIQQRFHGKVAISSGVKAGQQVITEGTIKIRPGSTVSVQG